MFYEFPQIDHIEQVLEVIKDKPEFIVKNDTDNKIRIVNYNVSMEDTFPKITDEKSKILRECRGITFDMKSGKILSRKLHKFFNVNEREETLIRNLDFTKPYDLPEKLDGSMITGLVRDKKNQWCTKMGITDISKRINEYSDFKPGLDSLAIDMAHSQHTAIFEWCSRKQRIVIDHPSDRLVLTQIRENVSGNYLPKSELIRLANKYKIEHVRYLNDEYGSDINVILKSIYDVEDMEGLIIDFGNHKLKVKSKWYCDIHKAMEHLIHEKDIIRLILDEKSDDIKSFISEDLKEKLIEFEKNIWKSIRTISEEIYWNVISWTDNNGISRKNFATHVMANHSEYAPLYFQLFTLLENNADISEQTLLEPLKNVMRKSCGSQTNVNAARHFILGTTWKV